MKRSVAMVLLCALAATGTACSTALTPLATRNDHRTSPTMSIGTHPTAKAAFPSPAPGVDLHSATAVAIAEVEATWTVNTTVDAGWYAGELAASAYMTPSYAASIRHHPPTGAPGAMWDGLGSTPCDDDGVSKRRGRSRWPDRYRIHRLPQGSGHGDTPWRCATQRCCIAERRCGTKRRGDTGRRGPMGGAGGGLGDLSRGLALLSRCPLAGGHDGDHAVSHTDRRFRLSAATAPFPGTRCGGVGDNPVPYSPIRSAADLGVCPRPESKVGVAGRTFWSWRHHACQGARRSRSRDCRAGRACQHSSSVDPRPTASLPPNALLLANWRKPRPGPASGSWWWPTAPVHWPNRWRSWLPSSSAATPTTGPSHGWSPGGHIRRVPGPPLPADQTALRVFFARPSIRPSNQPQEHL